MLLDSCQRTQRGCDGLCGLCFSTFVTCVPTCDDSALRLLYIDIDMYWDMLQCDTPHVCLMTHQSIDISTVSGSQRARGTTL